MIHPLLVSITDLTNAFTVFGFPATLIGLGFTYWQIHEARKALNLARDLERRLAEEVTVVLRNSDLGVAIYHPAKIRRGDLTRAELQGWIGIIRRDNKINYSLRYTGTLDYIKNIRNVRNAIDDKDKRIYIECYDNELDQFDGEHVPVHRELPALPQS